MANVGLIVAMRTEVPYGLKHTTDIYYIGDNAIRVAVSGIGCKRARRTTQEVCSGSLGFLPELLINSGFCGAVRNELGIGDLIIGNHLAYRGREIQLKNSLIEKIGGLLAGSETHIGRLETFRWPVLSRTRVARDTLAVDMESFAIAQIAAKNQIPVIFIKAVSDIVPKCASLISLLSLLRSLKYNPKKARAALSIAVNKILEEKGLMETNDNVRRGSDEYLNLAKSR